MYPQNERNRKGKQQKSNNQPTNQPTNNLRAQLFVVMLLVRGSNFFLLLFVVAR